MPFTLPRTRRAALLVATLLIAAAPASAVQAARPLTLPSPDRDARQVDDPGATPAADEILVRYRKGTSATERRALAGRFGLTRLHRSPNGRTEVVVADGRSPAAVRRQLAADPDVLAVAPNHRRELAEDASAEPGFDAQWGLHNVGQAIDGVNYSTSVADVDIDGLQALALGIGDPDVVVAVIDDGIDFDHPDLAPRAWTNPGEAGGLASNGIDDDGNGYIDDVHGWDFCNNDNSVHDDGEDGHGTHVAGTIAASLDGRGTVGVAPGVSLMALKFIDDSAQCGTDAMAIEAIDYAAAFGIRIINASWGGPEPSAVLDAAIGSSGALFVAAAGNDGVDLDEPGGDRFYPASSTQPNVISVAAIDQRGRLPSFSNRGAKSVDLAAPGTNILSTYPPIDGCAAKCYVWAAGTSMAAPHVAGVAALVGSSRSTLLEQPAALRARLLATGKAMSRTAGLTATGRIVDAFRALDWTPPPPTATDRFSVKVGTIVGATSVPAVVAWPQPAAHDVASYSIKRLGPSGWSTVDAFTEARSAASTVQFGVSYTYRVRAKDLAGNLSDAIDGPSVRATLYHDGSGLVRYSGSWRTVPSGSAFKSKLHTASKAGAWAQFTFSGRSFALVATRGPSRGKAKVYVDGVYASTVDLYRSSMKARVVVFSKAWTASGPHTVRLVVLGTKGHPRVDVDGFVVFR